MSDDNDNTRSDKPSDTPAGDEAKASDATEKAAVEETKLAEESKAEAAKVVEAPVVDVKDEAAAKKDEHVHQGEENLIAEADRPNVGVIGLVTFAIMVTVVVTVIGVYSFFSQTFRAEVSKKVYEVQDPALRDLRAMEDSRWSRYQWVDQKNGVVRLPKDRAKELVLADYGKMAAYVPGAPGTEPAAPTPGSAMPAASESAAPAASAAPSASASAAPSASAPASSAASAAPSASTKPAPSASAAHKPTIKK